MSEKLDQKFLDQHRPEFLRTANILARVFEQAQKLQSLGKDSKVFIRWEILNEQEEGFIGTVYGVLRIAGKRVLLTDNEGDAKGQKWVDIASVVDVNAFNEEYKTMQRFDHKRIRCKSNTARG